METQAFGFRVRTNAPEGQKRLIRDRLRLLWALDRLTVLLFPIAALLWLPQAAAQDKTWLPPGKPAVEVAAGFFLANLSGRRRAQRDLRSRPVPELPLARSATRLRWDSAEALRRGGRRRTAQGDVVAAARVRQHRPARRREPHPRTDRALRGLVVLRGRRTKLSFRDAASTGKRRQNAQPLRMVISSAWQSSHGRGP
jgi:hypothetical protein